MKTNSTAKGFEGSKKMSLKEFGTLSEYIYNNFGIRLPPVKKVMLEGRLQKRLKANNFQTFKDYIEFLFGKDGKSEIIYMIDAVSTNKTDFFRESMHFDYLMEVVLPKHIEDNRYGNLKIWSSAASSGEEPYTIAMCMEEFNKAHNAKVGYSILGTDISVSILKKAVEAIYTIDRIVNIPLNLKREYFLKSKNKANNTVRIVPKLRSNVVYKRLNLMDTSYNEIDNDYDIIFCRNVLIYFDAQTQEKVVNKLCEKLKKGGYFFLGHSESLIGKNVPLTQVKPTIFIKQ
ncbi:MAG: chemotaxis protein CheR [Cyclobacteriaceae bacterium]|nr:chemotaxis protein CheR [Cyclobacteriaceae bacterium]